MNLNDLDVHGELTTLSSCICPGYEAIFECVVTGGAATIWNGTAFRDIDNCFNNKITLRHSQFNQPEYNVTCGDGGQIIGRAISAMNDSYTSQLIVNVSQNLVGANIECANNNGSHVGTKQIQLTTGTFQLIILCTFVIKLNFITAPFPWSPPSNVMLSQINSSHLTFSWNSVSADCQAVHYQINTTNCGQCPNFNITSCAITCSPMATSTDLDTNSVSCAVNNNIMLATGLLETCAIMIQPVVCGNVSGNSSILLFNVSGTIH